MSAEGQSIVLNKKINEKGIKNHTVGYFNRDLLDSEWYTHFQLNLDGREPEDIIVHYAFILDGQKITGRKNISVAPLPDSFAFYQNYPNPFNPLTTIEYALPKETRVKIVIYDIKGREVKVLVDEIQDPGYRSVKWNSTNTIGEQVSTGMYFYMISSESYQNVKKMLLIK